MTGILTIGWGARGAETRARDLFEKLSVARGRRCC